MASKRVSTQPKKSLTPGDQSANQALAAFLGVKPADLKRMEAGEEKAKKVKKRRK